MHLVNLLYVEIIFGLQKMEWKVKTLTKSSARNNYAA